MKYFFWCPECRHGFATRFKARETPAVDCGAHEPSKPTECLGGYPEGLDELRKRQREAWRADANTTPPKGETK